MTGELRRLEPAEAADAAERAVASFGAMDEDAPARVRTRVEAGELWGWVEEGAVLGHCHLTTVDHWFNGGAVGCQHVASVAVPPEHRGKGVATRLMHAALAEGRRSGAGLSLLFPATTRLYRALGYEHAGHFSHYRIDARNASVDGVPLRRATAEDWPGIRACHRAFTRRLNGPQVDRTDPVWGRQREARFAYVLDSPVGGLEGYLLVGHRLLQGTWQHGLEIHDWAAVTPRALRSVVGFVGRHGTTAKGATVRGGVPDLWSALVAEQDMEEVGGFFWMARSLDPVVALQARGYTPGLSGAVTMSLADPVLETRDVVRLELDRGEAAVTRVAAGTPAVALDSRAFGPMFTGFRSAADLALLGLVDGDEAAIGWLSGAFAASPPLLLDFF